MKSSISLTGCQCWHQNRPTCRYQFEHPFSATAILTSNLVPRSSSVRPLFITWRDRQWRGLLNCSNNSSPSSRSFSSPTPIRRRSTPPREGRTRTTVATLLLSLLPAAAPAAAVSAGRDKKTLVSCRIDCFSRIEIDIVLNHCVNTQIKRERTRAHCS